MKNKKLTVIGVILGVLVVFSIFLYVAFYLPYRKISAKGNVLMASAKEMKSVFAKNNIDLLNTKYAKFSKEYADFEKEAESVYWASFIPYVKDFKSSVEAGHYIVAAGHDALVAITPYADLIGFKKGAVSFVDKPAEDRLQTAVLTLDKVLGKLDSISDNIKKAEERINSVDPNRYPKTIGKSEVRNRIINIKEQFAGLSALFVDAKPLLKNIPSILGKDKEKMYLVLFQNDDERRATGGFLTAYALFRINNGKMRIERSEDIYSLDNSIAVHPPAPREILEYHKGVSQFYIRDSNLSPDFTKSIGLFEDLYKRSGKKIDYDGIIAVDSKILVDMLTIFGDTEADGVVFSAKTDPRCNCPQVIYKLFDMVDRPTPYLRENRKGILGDLMFVLLHKALGFSPSKYWGTLMEAMFQDLNEKHILLYFKDKAIQQSVEKLNYAGSMRNYNGDFLSVNNVNFAGAKSNLFVQETITTNTTKTGNGWQREVTIEYRNPFPGSDCNLERGGLCLNATLRNWLRVYVPKGSKLVEFQGSQKKVNTYEDLGKTVYEGFMTVDPLGKATVIVKYTLPKDFAPNNYSLLVQKQSGTDGQKLKVNFGGRKLYEGLLQKDVEVRE